MNIDDLINRARYAAEDHGLDLHELSTRLAELAAAAEDTEGSCASSRGGGAAPAGTETLAGFVATLEEAAAGQLTETTRTYRTAWRFLSDGIRLGHTAASRDGTVQRPYSDEQVRRWLEVARDVNDDKELELSVPADPSELERDDAGVPIVWHGYGHLPISSFGSTRFMIAARWQRLRTVTDGRLRDEVRAAKGLTPREWTGNGSVETLMTATRYLFKAAAGDNLVPPGTDPVGTYKKPKRLGSGRSLLTAEQVEDFHLTATSTGDDPDLDALLFRFHFLTGARQEAAARLRLRHLDDAQQAIAIPDKANRTKEGGRDVIDDLAPVTREFLTELRVFAASRGSSGPDDPVFRQRRSGAPLTHRRYNTIYGRLRDQHEWARTYREPVGVHHLRGFSAARIEEIAGRPAKMRFLRHKPNGQTDGYGQAGFEHLCWAFATWTGTEHVRAVKPSYLS